MGIMVSDVYEGLVEAGACDTNTKADAEAIGRKWNRSQHMDIESFVERALRYALTDRDWAHVELRSL